MESPAGRSATYLNPVHRASCADPFVLKHGGAYWCFCTGIEPDGRCFGVLRSDDLVRWTRVGAAMAALPGDHTCYWAPEVSYHGGRFYLYYSVGNEERMQIRVAVAERPAGPYEDAGVALTGEPFAIDPHVFEDDDGTRYLFYATDFLKHSHVGTGTVVDRMIDPLTLAGQPRVVSRARFDWQVYDPARAEKGGVRWHTVEGPFVLKRKGVYFQMFSAGNWKNVSYGVAAARARDLLQEGEWEQPCDGEAVAPLMRTIPGRVIGPGHNSVVRGPDNRQLYCVYHRWDVEAGRRELAIDRLDAAGDRLIVLGPTSTPQRAPNAAALRGARPRVRLAGGGAFLLEAAAHGALRLALRRQGAVLWSWTGLWRDRVMHQLRLEVDPPALTLWLDGARPGAHATLAAAPEELVAEGDAIEAFEMTPGWEHQFAGSDADPVRLGWRPAPRDAWRIAEGRLVGFSPEVARIERETPHEAYELVVNLRLEGGDEACAGVIPALGRNGDGPIVVVRREGERWVAEIDGPGGTRAAELPPGFDGRSFGQLRFLKEDGRMTIDWEGRPLFLAEAPAGATWPGLLVQQGVAGFEMVRLTALGTTSGGNP